MTKSVEVFTDGACSGNPGPGGWGVILRYKGIEKELSGYDPNTTNNRMELTAVISALKALKEPCSVELYSDSTYVCNAINKNWLDSWKAKNYIKHGQPIPNVELWRELDILLHTHDVKFNWVRGHSGHPENERCDKLATTAIKTKGA